MRFLEEVQWDSLLERENQQRRSIFSWAGERRRRVREKDNNKRREAEGSFPASVIHDKRSSISNEQQKWLWNIQHCTRELGKGVMAAKTVQRMTEVLAQGMRCAAIPVYSGVFLWLTTKIEWLSNSVKVSIAVDIDNKRILHSAGYLASDNYTFTFLVRTSAQLLAHRTGSSVHGVVLKYGFEHDSHVQSGSIYMHAGLGGLAACYWMFSSIREPDLVCQTAMVSACVKMGDFTFARKLFDKMPYKDPIAWNRDEFLRYPFDSEASCPIMPKHFLLFILLDAANFLMKTRSLHSWDPHAMTFQMFLEKSRKILSSLATFRILQQPIYSLPDLISMMAQTKVSLDRITSFLRLDDLQSDVIERLPKGSFDTAIEIVDGNFSWDLSSHNPTLKDINLRVCRGMRVAVCGTVGSGKSSLLSCMMGEVPKISGILKLCGTKAYVAQSPWIQSGKIAENILFGKEMDRERYERVLDACYLKKDLEVLSFGDQTVIGTRLFKECLLGLLGSKTVIYVTHQVEFLPAADLILVIKMESYPGPGKIDEVTIHVSNAQKAHASLVETDDGDSKQDERGNSGDVCWSSDFFIVFALLKDRTEGKELLSSKTSLNVRRRENNDADTSGQILFAARTRMKYGSGAKLRFWSILEVAEKLCGSLPIYHPERRHSTAKSSHIIPKIQLSNYFEGHLSKASTDKGFQWSREDTLVTSSAQLKKSPIQFSYNSESDAHRNTFSSSSIKFELSSFDEATLSIDDSVDQIAKVLNSFRTWCSDIHGSIGYGKFGAEIFEAKATMLDDAHPTALKI
ncbi:ABC transporter C family member 3 [Vitis vinifera]|uniref:ABC transporter C family member 3 n=1 Tax=Vitis vinifera TaxID=29760 RepID=A0A438FCR7_VITVI|nr:ABC transporter C family member 3 [Vitis vinifera]